MTGGKRTTRIRDKVGNVLAVPLGEDRFGFAWVLNSPLVAFFDRRCRAGDFPPVDAIVGSPIAFRIWVMKSAVTSGKWPFLGHMPVPEHSLEPLWFFKQDSINGRIHKTLTGAEEVPATTDEAEGLECAAVWSDVHVEERLRAHFEGRPSIFAESMKVKPPEFFEAKGNNIEARRS